MKWLTQLLRQPLMSRLFKQRVMKFGTVGASGVVVNLSVLFVCQEFIFTAIKSVDMRLNISLATAILFATINNFFWNRAWTWRDRMQHSDKKVLLHFGQFALACWLGILLQVILTKLLVVYVYYLIANATAIVLASVFNFVVNNFWTFRSLTAPEDIALQKRHRIEPESDRKIKEK